MGLRLKVMKLHFRKKQTVLLTKLLTKAFVHIVIKYFFKLIYLVPAITSKNI